MSANVLEVVAGILLLFFLPGYTVTKAVFPEWRIRGSVATLRLLEIVALAFVTSIAFTVLIGYALLVGSPAGFQAYWTDPVLEAGLAAVALVGFVAGWFRGAYRREPPAPYRPEPEEDASTWELVVQLDELRRRERRLRHALRQADSGSPEAARLTAELEAVQGEVSTLSTRREAEYAG